MMLDTIVAISIGIGLAAACGFRVFVPTLIIGIAARVDLLTLADGFQWMGSWLAIATFGTATVLEVGAYYLPWLDNLLDTASTPLAIVAGVIVSAAFIQDMHPVLKWSLAVIAGGGAAGTIKAGLAGLRVGSTLTTGGAANPIVSTFEWVIAIAMSVLAIFLPIIAAVVAIALVAFFVRFAYAFVVRRSKPDSKESPVTSGEA
jgi:hypothetical protein